jgi:catechol 2,3-dioxygenase-like lactoylglutathione lyase family enzyme
MGDGAGRMRTTTGAAIMIDHIDHVVLTTTDPEACIRFYTEVLGMKVEIFGDGRTALRFGNQKINLHVKGREYEPKAHLPVPGALDLCFIAAVPLDDFIAHLGRKGVTIIEGPVMKTGAVHKLRSVYMRDPDLNLIEVSEPA